MVSASGSVTGVGQIAATRIDYLGAGYSAASGIQASGVIQNLNTTARTFTMGSLTVNYSLAPATTLMLSNGGMVIAGATTLPLSGTLNANEITVIGGGGTQPVGSVIDTSIAIKGPVEQVNVLGGTFTVMGQTVSYNTTTQFPSTSANTLVVGYVVRVTAAPNNLGGQLMATRVELVGTTYTPGTAVQTSGTIQNLNVNARTFTLGTLTVNYTNVAGLAFTPANGMSVIVGAMSTPTAPWRWRISPRAR